MDRQVLIDRTINKIRLLPDMKIKEIDDFADFLLSKIDDKIILLNSNLLKILKLDK